MRVGIPALIVALVALPMAAAQDPAIFVAPGETLVVEGDCGRTATLSSLTTITIAGTVRAQSINCDEDPTTFSAPWGTDLEIEAPLIVILDGGRIEAAPGFDALPITLTEVNLSINAQYGGRSGEITLKGAVEAYGGQVVLAPGGDGADIICDVGCYPAQGAREVHLSAGRGGDSMGLEIDGTVIMAPTVVGAKGGDGGDAYAQLATFVGQQAGSHGINVSAIAGWGGDGTQMGAGGDATAYAPNGRTGNDAVGSDGQAGGNGGTAWAYAGNGGEAQAFAGHGAHGGHSISDPCSGKGGQAGHGGAGGEATAAYGTATAGNGGDGGASVAPGGKGGNGGAGGRASVLVEDIALAGDGGNGGDGRVEAGQAGLGGFASAMDSAEEEARAYKVESGDSGIQGILYESTDCTDIPSPTPQGEPATPGTHSKSEPAPAQVVWMIMGVLGTALVARKFDN